MGRVDGTAYWVFYILVIRENAGQAHVSLKDSLILRLSQNQKLEVVLS